MPQGIELDCEYNCQLALGPGEYAQLEFTVGYGSMKDHARFTVINSIGFEWHDETSNTLTLCIEYQKKSVDVHKLLREQIEKTTQIARTAPTTIV
jgi:hypothetical protein